MKCPYNKKCGGCQNINLPYEEQLKLKQRYVDRLLCSFGKVNPIIGMEDPYHYRNKVHHVVCADSKGNGYTGIYAENSHRVIPVDHCLIENEKADEICASVASLMKSFKMKAYNEDRGTGFLRHILIRTGHLTGQILVVLVVASPVFPSKHNFVKALRKLHPEITSIVANVNNRGTSMVLGEKQQVLYGKGYIEDILCGKRFRISPKSFYQVNSVQTEVLYAKAVEYARLSGKETVIDAYSGIGTIGMVASDHAKEVISIELNEEAVRDAFANAKNNRIRNIRFIKADAGAHMKKMAIQKQHADVVFMDPPRAGSDARFIDSVVRLGPERIVYISCNPVTLKRDLEMFGKKGYKVRKIQPVDMFPGTEHVETVCCLYHQKKEFISVPYEPKNADYLKRIPGSATYGEIKEWIQKHYDGMKVSNLYIAQIKDKHGLDKRENYNISKNSEAKVPVCPPEKEQAIEAALRHFRMIPKSEGLSEASPEQSEEK